MIKKKPMGTNGQNVATVLRLKTLWIGATVVQITVLVGAAMVQALALQDLRGCGGRDSLPR